MSDILLVEDDENFANDCLLSLYREGFTVEYCVNARDAYTKIRGHDYSLAIIDLMLSPNQPDEGLQIQKWLLSKKPPPPVIFMSVRTDRVIPVVAAAMRNGAKNFLEKDRPDSIHQIVISAHEVLMQEKNKIFLSFGHNELLKLRLKDFIENRLRIRTIVLADQPAQGLTIVEMLEKAAKQCSFALILLTKDDEQKDDAVRARQNVIHELGFFQAKYGRKNVVLLAERGVELFSNISGIMRIEFEPAHFESIFDPLRREIESSSLFPGS